MDRLKYCCCEVKFSFCAQMQNNPKNTIYAAKRLIGRPESDALKKDIEHLQWDLDVIYNEVGVPQFKGGPSYESPSKI